MKNKHPRERGRRSRKPGNGRDHSQTEMTMNDANNNDLLLDADIAELEREGQKLIDRDIAARVELAAVTAALNEYEAKVEQGAARALAYVRQYRNPATPNPTEPLVPEVAAPAPTEEPPVFTDVSSPDLVPGETSGGFAPVIDEAFNVPEIPPAAEPTPANDTPASDA